MNETVIYEWSEQIGKSALDAFYKSQGSLRKFLYIYAFALIAVILITSYVVGNFTDLSNLLILGVVLIGGSIYLKAGKKKMIQGAARLYEKDPKVTVSITSESIAISSVKSINTYEWDMITKVLRVDNVLLSFSEKLLLFSLPSEFFTSEQIDFIVSNGNSTASAQQNGSAKPLPAPQS